MNRRCVALLLAVTACDGIESMEPGPEPPAAAFSQASAGFGWDFDIERELGLPEDLQFHDEGAAAPFKARITALYFAPPPIDSAAIFQEFRKWFTSVVVRNMTGPANDVTLFRAVSDYWVWILYADALYGAEFETLFATQLAQFDHIAAPTFLRAIDGNLKTCRAASSISALANAIFWFKQAAYLQLLDVPPLQYDEDKLKNDILATCAEIILTEIDLPQILDVGTDYTMRLTHALDIGKPAIRTPAVFHVGLGSIGATIQQITGFTDAAGVIERVVRPNVAGAVEFIVTPCLVLPGRTAATPYVCSADGFAREAQGATPPPPPPPPPPSLTALSGTWHFNIVGNPSNPYCDHVGGNTGGLANIVVTGSALSGTWQTAHSCGIGVTMNGTMTGTIEDLEFGGHRLIDWTITITGSSLDGCMLQIGKFVATAPANLPVGVPSGFNQLISEMMQNPNVTTDCTETVLIGVAMARIAP